MPERGGAVQCVDLSTGVANRVWKLTDATGTRVIKQYGDPSRAVNELLALTLLAAHDIPGPRVLRHAVHSIPARLELAFIDHHQHAPRLDRHPAMLHGLAPTLTRTFQITGPPAGSRFGRLDAIASGGGFATWEAYLHDRLDAYTHTIAHDPTLAGAHAVADTLRATIDRGLPASPCLLHHDLRPAHIITTRPNRARLLLDWEHAIFGDPLSDVARLSVRLGPHDPQPFLDLAGSVVGARYPAPELHRRVRLYRKIRLLANVMLGIDADRPILRRQAAAALAELQQPDQPARQRAEDCKSNGVTP